MKTIQIFTFVLPLLLILCQPVPVTQRKQLQLIPRQQILALSFESYKQIQSQFNEVSGTADAQMVQRVGNRIRNATEKYLQGRGEEKRLEGFQWEFTLFNADTVLNAFAMPGGKVGVFTGMLPLTRDENGLAVVMGHEIAHAVADHGNERMSQILLVEMGGIALDEALRSRGKETRRFAIAAFGLGAQVGLLLPYSRLHESEADELGLYFMALAGYDPRAAIDFWERMGEKRNGEPPELINTHPSDRTRIEKLEEIMPKAMELYQQR